MEKLNSHDLDQVAAQHYGPTIKRVAAMLKNSDVTRFSIVSVPEQGVAVIEGRSGTGIIVVDQKKECGVPRIELDLSKPYELPDGLYLDVLIYLMYSKSRLDP